MTRRRIGFIVACCALVSLGVRPGAAQTAQSPAGSIDGVLVDAATQRPLPGAMAVIQGPALEAVTDEHGRFSFVDVPVGSYVIEFSYPGVVTLSRPDVVVKPASTTDLRIEMPMRVLGDESVDVRADYFSAPAASPGSSIGLSAQEIRKAAGSAGDISRLIYGLPSVAKTNDQLNTLIVRGGSPLENSFYVDGIELPNINHFQTQGTSGGAIGLVNIALVDSVTFSAGGFGAQFGDRLSSVTEISLREGTRSRTEAQVAVSLAGASATAEGKLPGSLGTWIVSANRSYLDLLIDRIGAGAAPKYADALGKLVIQPAPAHRFSLLVLAGFDDYTMDVEQSLEASNSEFGSSRQRTLASGVHWLWTWSARGYSTVAMSAVSTRFEQDYAKTATEVATFRNDSTETTAAIRNVNHYRIGDRHSIQFGVDVKRLASNQNYRIAASLDEGGRALPVFESVREDSTWKVGAFAQSEFQPLPRLTVNLGGRIDTARTTGNSYVSPRMSLAYALTNRTRLVGSGGVFRQTLPPLLLFQGAGAAYLRDPRTTHMVVGVHRLIAPSVRLVLEAYEKSYTRMPMDPLQPQLFVLDDVYGTGLFRHGPLTNDGRARSRGVELTVQKKLTSRLYGTAGVSYSQASYRDLEGTWRPRSYDNGIVASVDAGWQASDHWDFSGRLVVAGGLPYTPFDVDVSRALRTGVHDLARANEERQPMYQSLSLRGARRFDYKGSSLNTYVSVWNATNRENVAFYYWNERDNKPATQHQWHLLPVFGVEYHF